MSQGTVAIPTRDAQPSQEAELTIEPFDSHGTARARFKNRSIEVEHGIPGERVRALVFGRRRMWAKIVEVIEPAADRVLAPCPAFHQGCGGCQWQMLDYASQVQRKRTQVDGAMEAAGLELRVAQMHAMTDPWRYRWTAGISLGRHAGFRRHGSQSIVGLADCPISHPMIGAFMAHLNAAIDAGSLPNYRGQVTLETRVVGRADAVGLHVCIRPTPGATLDVARDVGLLVDAVASFPPVRGILWHRLEEPPRAVWGEAFAEIEVAGRTFVLSAASFFQTNMTLLPILLDRIVTGTGSTDEGVVVDVYGGVGLFGLCLAPTSSRVIELELDPVAIEAARHSICIQGLSNVELRRGSAESILSDIGHVDTLIVDPPRTGLTPRVLAAVSSLRPGRILYVSCLATSLARDIVELAAAGYRAGTLEAFDFYPQTYHVELFTVLQMEGPARISE